ncbi:MAG: hypothetical protein MSL80_07685 [Helicobacter sp.]|uniref:hypothetical protein n=1 Tax=Helicobacter sp. TaxID=218 RepID=UPI003750B15A|nr:hypothetical protein [Helicobacter sp.]
MMLRFSKKLPFVNLQNTYTHNLIAQNGDFLELGEYLYGQDARLLAPKACLKYHKPMIKIFQQETLSYLHIFLLPSQSLLLYTPTKLSAIVQLSTLLVHSAQKFGLKPILHYLHSHSPQIYTTPAHIYTMLHTLQDMTLLAKDQLNHSTEIFHHIIAHKHKKGLGVIIGDFYKLETTHIPKISLKNYFALYALCVRTKQEWEPDFLNLGQTYQFYDIQTQEVCEDTLSLAQYKTRLAHFDTKLRAYFSRMGAKLAYVNPQDSLLNQLQKIFYT